MLLLGQRRAIARSPCVPAAKCVPVARKAVVQRAAAPAAAEAAPAPAPATPATTDGQKPKAGVQRRISILKDKSNDRKALGAVLGKLRDASDGRLFIDPQGDDQCYRAVRLLCTASDIMAKETPSKVVEVVVSNPVDTRKPQVEGQPPVRKLRLSAGSVDAQVPADPIKPLPDSERAKASVQRTGKELERVIRVSSSTRVEGLAGAIMDRLEAYGEVTMQAVGPAAINGILRAMRKCRYMANSNYGRGLIMYLSPLELEPQDKQQEQQQEQQQQQQEGTKGNAVRACQITVRPAPPKPKPSA